MGIINAYSVDNYRDNNVARRTKMCSDRLVCYCNHIHPRQFIDMMKAKSVS